MLESKRQGKKEILTIATSCYRWPCLLIYLQSF